MNIKIYIYTLMAIFFPYKNYAQDIGLVIGDKLPNLKFSKLINYNKIILSTSDFSDRLLIIDFWATSCSGCVAGLPKMDSLQKEFKERIRILPVTYEPKNYVSHFWKNSRYTKNLTLPSVVDDTVFKKYFKHDFIPHEVWIYKGKVIAITNEEYVDSKNIKKVLANQKINWPVKNDFYKLDRSKTLFEIDTFQVSKSDEHFKYSAISGYKEGVNSSGLSGGSGLIRDSIKNKVRIFFINQPIYTTYQLCFLNILNSVKLTKPSRYLEPNDVIWEVKDKSRYKYAKEYGYSQSWLRTNGICYESLTSNSIKEDSKIYLNIISDLNNLFGLNVRWEKRIEKVYVLAKIGKYYTNEDVLSKNRKVIKKESNVTLADIVYELNKYPGNPYVFDDENLGGYKVYLNLSTINHPENLRRGLNKIGFDLKPVYRQVDRLYFSEIDGGLIDTRAKISN